MNIETLINQIKSYKQNTICHITFVNTTNNTFNGSIVLNSGDIITYSYDNKNVSQIMKLCTVSNVVINNLKTYLTMNAHIFEKKYQQIHIDKKEFRVYINIDGRELSLVNDFINMYEPSLYLDLAFKIDYLINITPPNVLDKNIIYRLISTNKVKIESNLDKLNCGIEISYKMFSKNPVLKIKKEFNVSKTNNPHVIYWTIKLLKTKYFNIFNAPGSEYKTDQAYTYLYANYKDGLFKTIEERDILNKTISELVDELKSLR